MHHKPDITLYLGGTRSGKSLLAENRVRAEATGVVLYVATAERNDHAMQERITKHQGRRPESWHTLECPLHLAPHIAVALEGYGIVCAGTKPFSKQGVQKNLESTAQAEAYSVIKELADKPTILLDCVTLWVSNILFSLPDQNDLALLESHVRHEVKALITLMHNTDCRWVIVSGETGLGGIASTQLERNFQDALGVANQIIASCASSAFFVVAGRSFAL